MKTLQLNQVPPVSFDFHESLEGRYSGEYLQMKQMLLLKWNTQLS